VILRRWKAADRTWGAGLLASGISIGLLPALAHAGPAATAATTGRAVERIELSAGFYLLATPAGYKRGDRPPLVVCLHETDTGADTILAFWRRLKTPIGMLLAAPEHHKPGWRQADLPCIQAMLAHLRKHVTYDPKRVLLTGYSAGGAMAFHLLYAEAFPATAVAATANYVPPSVTAKMVAARRDVPIFYAVGMRDVNQDRMRASIELLRTSGGRLTLLRPDIGHALDRDIGQQAMDWFVKTMTQQTLTQIDQAAKAGEEQRYAAGMAVVEPILAQRRWHPPKIVARADSVRIKLEQPGREHLARAKHLTDQGQLPEAIDVLRRVEVAYGTARLSLEARKRRETLQADPKVRAAEQARQEERREQASRESLVRAQRLVVSRKYHQAKEQCRAIIRTYPGTTAATRAQTLLDQLRRAGK